MLNLGLLADDKNSSIMDKVNKSLWDITPQLTSIALVTIFICAICIIYNVKVRNYNIDQPMSGMLVIVEGLVKGTEGLVVSVMGKKYAHLTPYILYIGMYIFVGCLFSIVGFEPPASSYTVTLAMGLVTFFGIIYFGLKVKKLRFFKKYIFLPELLMQFIPLISISFRLFGNMLGGAIILGLAYAAMIGLSAKIFFPHDQINSWSEGASNYIWFHKQFDPKYMVAGLNIGSITIFPFLHMYFDLFDGGIQAFVFLNLTLSYWSESVHDEKAHQKEDNFQERKEQTL
ncbi:F0F1 ATP synthase subunit A [Spiroplasma endosymbiont of Crioceris asparagi]|uniref:F0F1 ATP synthase subunit A n=1 Tax=Spiroplasma endosymbiont of Crioceris asparagi TaxID=3066286 RepID=UPI0030D1C5B6